jgi:hypothetical protein
MNASTIRSLCTVGPLIAFAVLPIQSWAQDRVAPTPAPAIFRTMSQAEARATGVSKLTPTERARLESWIARLTANVAKMAASARFESDTAAHAGVVESRIAGDFTGWDVETIYFLENGQAWQQASFDRMAVYLRRPRVTLHAAGDTWRMAVEGLGLSVPVRRLR